MEGRDEVECYEEEGYGRGVSYEEEGMDSKTELYLCTTKILPH